MNREGLDRTLAQMVIEQNELELTAEAKTINLLRQLRKNTAGIIDVAYVLNGALTWAEPVEEGLKEGFTTCHYNPKVPVDCGPPIGPEVFWAVDGTPDPSHPLLLVDDGWDKGTYKRAADCYFRKCNYTQIWMLHTLGNCAWESTVIDERHGYTRYSNNSVLCSSERMLAYFNEVRNERRQTLMSRLTSGLVPQ